MRTWRAVLATSTAVALATTGCAGKEERAAEAAEAAGAEWTAGTPTVKIGLVAPLTGPFAVLGVSQQNSMQVEVDKINEAGGLGGAQLEIVARDSGLDPGRAVQAANELVGDEQVAMVVGPSISAFYNATKDIYEQNQMLNCQPAVATGDFGELEYGFRSQDRYQDGVDKLLEYLAGEGIESVGLIYDEDDTGRAYAEYMPGVLEELGMEWAGWQQTRQDDQSHRAYVNALSDADAIFISSNASGAKTLAAADEAGYEGTLLGASGVQNINFIESGGEAADGLVWYAPYYPYPSRIPQEEWREGYREHITEVVDQFGENVAPTTGATSPQGTAIAADCIYAFAAAANAAETLEPDAVAAEWEALDLAETETPSGNSITPGDAHEHYDAEDIQIYRWTQDEDGWYTELLSE